jgi:hypothetical protein
MDRKLVTGRKTTETENRLFAAQRNRNLAGELRSEKFDGKGKLPLL